MIKTEKVMVSGIEVKGIKLPDRKGLVPELWPPGSEDPKAEMLVPIYYCQICEPEPEVVKGQIAVSAGHDSHLHDEFVTKRLLEISQLLVS